MRALPSALAILISCLPLSAPARAQDACKRIAATEQSLYGFRPAKLSDAERKAKAAAMDSYWTLVKKAGPSGIACLRAPVQKQTDGFAVFDEASLLFSLDKSPESRSTATQAVAKTDLADV